MVYSTLFLIEDNAAPFSTAENKSESLLFLSGRYCQLPRWQVNVWKSLENADDSI